MLRFGVGIAASMLLAACGPSIDKSKKLSSSDPEAVLFLGQALSGDSVRATKATPELTSVPLRKTCTFPKASRNAKTVYIKGFGRGTAGIKFHGVYKDESANSFGRLLSHPNIDVIVTDSSQPIFLVIGSTSKNMWTIHTAPGVKIDGIAMNTEYGSSIANVPDGAKVGFVAKDGSLQEKCFENLVEPITVEEMVAINAGVGYQPSKEDLKKYKTIEKNGKDWLQYKFPRKFGGPASDTIFADPERGFKGILVGPVPVEPLVASPITRVHYPEHLNVIWADKKDAIDTFVAEERAVLRNIQKGAINSIAN